MKIVVLGLTSDDVGEEFRQMQCLFGDAIDSIVVSTSFDTSIRTLFFSPILTRPGIGPFPDKISYLRREPAINAAVNVSHEAWSLGDRRDRLNLIADALLGVISNIKETKFDSQTKLQLREIAEKARQVAPRQLLS